MRKKWTDADSALLERVCASGKMDDGFPATDGRLAKELGCCRRTIIRQRQVRQIRAPAGPRQGGFQARLFARYPSVKSRRSSRLGWKLPNKHQPLGTGSMVGSPPVTSLRLSGTDAALNGQTMILRRNTPGSSKMWM